MRTQPLGVGTLVDAQNPWPGLSAFDEAAQSFFNGRDAESAELLRLAGQAPLTVLFGKSGLGKTSLVQAGLFPRLRQQNILPIYVRLDVRDRSAPLIQQAAAALQAEIDKHGVDAPASNAEESLWEYLHGRDVQWWSPKNQPLTPLFVFDQFEEAFIHGAENADAIERLRLDLADLIENRIPEDLARRIEAGALAEQLDLRGQRYKLLLSFREDFLPEVEGWKADLPSLMRNRLRLLPMSADRAWQVVSGETPAGRTHELVNDATAREIVRFVAAVQTGDDKAGRGKSLHKTADLPWDKLEIEPALLSLLCEGLNEKRKGRAQATIDAALLDETGEAIIGDFYQNCVADVPDRTRRFIEDALITEGGFRNSYPLQDALDQGLLSEPLLRRLVDRRLLRIDHQLGADRVELIHDRLTDVVREHRDRERLRRLRYRRRMVVTACAGLGLLLVGVAATLAVLFVQARSEKARALQALRVAVAWDYTEKDPRVSVAFLREVDNPENIPGWRGATGKVLKILGTSFSIPLVGSEANVTSAEFSPDGSKVVTASLDHTARLWNLDGLEIAVLRHVAPVTSAKFSPDGRYILTASEDGTATSWNSASGEKLGLFRDAGRVTNISASPDARQVLIITEDGTARIWQINGTGRPTGEPRVLRGRDALAAFSPDGKYTVLASSDGTVRIFGPDSRAGPLVLRGHGDMPTDAAFSPDGKYIVIASRDGTARIWRIDGTGEPLVLIGHEDILTETAFSPDGKYLVTASRDGTARIWRIGGASEPVILRGGDRGAVWGASFSPDARNVVTVSEDGKVRLWTLDGILDSVFNVSESRLLGAHYSPDGSKLVVVSSDRRAEILYVLPPVSTLQMELGKQETSCVSARMRSYLLGQSETEAERDYEACEDKGMKIGQR